MRLPRLPALLATGTVLLTSLQPARALAAEPSPAAASAAPVPYVIAVDPGHGGSYAGDLTIPWDPGVVAGSVMEKDITLDLGLRLLVLLRAERVRVVMTRTTDRFMTIADRWAVVAASGAQMFVSLHVNAFDGDPSITGLTVFYPKPDSLPFARAIESGLSQALAPFQIADDGVAAKPELWIHSEVPTVTVEPAYLTNPREAALLQRDEFRQAVAQGILQGILTADPRIEGTRRAVERAGALAAQRAPVLHPPRVPAFAVANWWLYAGTAMVLLLLIRGRAAAARPAASRLRRRPSRRLLRRRRSLNRRA